MPRCVFTSPVRRFLQSLFVVLLSSACRPSQPPLASTQPSTMALAQAVLVACEQTSLPALRALALNESEFRDHVWPDLPAARPERNLPFSFVWGDLHQKSEAALSMTLRSHGGKHYELVGVRFLRETTKYATYVVHRETELTVKDRAGAQLLLRLFGSVLEKDGVFKVFSYVND